MKKIREEQNLLTASKLSQLLTTLLYEISDETLLALEAVRVRPTTGLASFLMAEIYSREIRQIDAELSLLYVESAGHYRSPPELRQRIDELKADRTRATRRANTRKGRRYV